MGSVLNGSAGKRNKRQREKYLKDFLKVTQKPTPVKDSYNT